MNNFVGIYVVPLPSGIALLLSVREHSPFRTLLKLVSAIRQLEMFPSNPK